MKSLDELAESFCYLLMALCAVAVVLVLIARALA